jgi:hypothetical protein
VAPANFAMEKSFNSTTPTNKRSMISREGSSPPWLDLLHRQPQQRRLHSGILGMIENCSNQRWQIGAEPVTRRWG